MGKQLSRRGTDQFPTPGRSTGPMQSIYGPEGENTPPEPFYGRKNAEIIFKAHNRVPCTILLLLDMSLAITQKWPKITIKNP